MRAAIGLANPTCIHTLDRPTDPQAGWIVVLGYRPQGRPRRPSVCWTGCKGAVGLEKKKPARVCRRAFSNSAGVTLPHPRGIVGHPEYHCKFITEDPFVLLLESRRFQRGPRGCRPPLETSPEGVLTERHVS